MKPVNFDYIAANTVEEALLALLESNGTAKLIAGGQSLMPMLNMRLARPSTLIDINTIPQLNGIKLLENQIRIGATVRHHQAEQSPIIIEHLPLLAKAIPFVGHAPIRSRGTLVGSIVHADPSAEIPLIALLLDAFLEINHSEGMREVPVSEFFYGYMMTDIQPEEMVTNLVFPHVELPSDVKRGCAFEEMTRRDGDFAIVSAGCQMEVQEGVLVDIRLGLGGVGGAPIRLIELENQLTGKRGSSSLFSEIVKSIEDLVEPDDDPSASAEYRLRVAIGLAKKVLEDAFFDAVGKEV